MAIVKMSNVKCQMLLIFTKFLLFATAFTPLIVGGKIFPFVFGKFIFFRSLVELTLILFLVFIFFELNKPSQERKLITHYSLFITQLFKNPIFLALIVFLIAMLVSTAFGINIYRSFWGDVERGDGMFAFLHYAVFLILLVVIFQEKDWMRFYKLFLLISIVVIGYGFVQYYFGANWFSSVPAHPRIERPGSFFDNAAHLGTYLLFVLVFSAMVFFKKTQEKNYLGVFSQYIAGAVFLTALAMIFISATRAVLLGLSVGVISIVLYGSFARGAFTPLLRNISRVLFAAIFVFGIIFWFTRANDFWQKAPGFNRIAQITLSKQNIDYSTKMRLLAWQLGFEAFKEKPIFGWGPESFLFVYERYYNPDMSLFGETWLDRAHNKIIEVGVTQGSVGVIAYMGIFVAAGYMLFQKKRSILHIIIGSGLIAYFTQELFSVDHIGASLPFFVLLGFLVSESISERLQSAGWRSKISNPWLPVTSYWLPVTKIVIVIVIGMVGYSMYAYNYIPYRQAYAFWRSASLSAAEEMVATLKKAMEPYNFAQLNIRKIGIDTIYTSAYFENKEYIANPRFQPIADTLLGGLDELINREPYDVRILIKKVELLNAIANNRPEESKKLFAEAEIVLKKAVEIAPRRQSVYYHLAFNLALQERFDEARAIAERAIALSPRVPSAHYHLAAVYTLAGEYEKALEELAIVENLDPSFTSLQLQITDLNNIAFMYRTMKRYDKIAAFVSGLLKDGKIGLKKEYYLIALQEYVKKRDAENVISIASHLSTFADLAERMRAIMSLAKEEKWDTFNISFTE